MRWLVVLLFWVHGLVYTRIAFSDMQLTRKLYFWVAGLVGGVALAGLTGVVALSTGLGGTIIAVISLTLGGICHCGFVAKAGAELIFEAARRAKGDHLLVVEKTYDQAEAAEKRRDWDTAERLYRAEVDGDPADAQARIRLGEIYLKLDRVDEATLLFAAALPLLDEPEQQGPLAFRLSEIYSKSGKLEQAREVLSAAVSDLAGTRYEAFAQKRLDSLG